MIIDENSPVVTQKSNDYWMDELQNAKILLVQVEKAINTFLSNGNIQSYTIDTGQDKQTVTRADLNNLRSQRTELLSQIQVLESRLNIGGSHVAQVCPGF